MNKVPLRVAHIIGKANWGGVSAVAMNYYRYIDRDSFQFDFFIDGMDNTSIEDEIRTLGGGVYKLPAYTDNVGENLAAFRKIIQDCGYQYRIIHAHMNTLSTLWLWQAKKLNIPHRISHSHSSAGAGEGIRNVAKLILRPFAGLYANQKCACSELAGRWLFGNKAYDSGEVRTIYNAIPVERFLFQPHVRARVRSELGLKNTFVVGHVGRFMFQKNHSFLIDIFVEVVKRKPDSVLLLVGEGELRMEMEKKARVLQLEDKIWFLGNRADVADLYQAIDIFLLPSHYEGLPVVGIEAQMSGLPCLFSSAITPEACLGANVRIVSLRESAAVWADAVVELQVQNEAVRKEIAPYLLETYDIRKAAPRLMDWYTQILTGQVNY